MKRFSLNNDTQKYESYLQERKMDKTWETKISRSIFSVLSLSSVFPQFHHCMNELTQHLHLQVLTACHPNLVTTERKSISQTYLQGNHTENMSTWIFSRTRQVIIQQSSFSKGLIHTAETWLNSTNVQSRFWSGSPNVQQNYSTTRMRWGNSERNI